MKEQILKLRDEGKTYNEIQKALGCSKGTIAYHCGQGQKQKTKYRTEQLRQNNPLLQKVDHFKTSVKKCVQNRVQHFHRSIEKNFTYLDIIEKYGYETKCYLTGEDVSFRDAMSFALDHIIPRSRGGTNELHNVGVTTPAANQAKSNLLLPEFLELCEKVLKNFGYKVEKPNQSC
jgi:5-methylcytosine-specific restriction endonuclease McrA